MSPDAKLRSRISRGSVRLTALLLLVVVGLGNPLGVAGIQARVTVTGPAGHPAQPGQSRGLSPLGRPLDPAASAQADATGAPDADPTTTPPPGPPTPTSAPPVASSRPTGTPTPSADADPSSTPTATAAPEPEASPAPTATPGPAPSPAVSYIVTFRPTAASGARTDVLASAGATLVTEIPALHMAVVSLPAADAADRAAGLTADSSVAQVERDRERRAKGSPNDPGYADQWSLPRIGWDAVRDGPAPRGHAVVAILDTGVDATHPDLAGRLLPGASFVGGVAPGRDPNGHGTWMAGIVAAEVDNHMGIAGVAYANTSVLPVTVLGADGAGLDSDIVTGLVYATDAGADVILMSFSAPGYSAALQAAIDYAWAHGVVVVAAIGNDGSTKATFPAGDRGVVGVASTDRADAIAPGSNHGPAAFMAAPGVDILTTDVGGGYQVVTGTSAAAAEVAGAAALLRAADPGATNGMIVGRLARTAAPAGAREQTGNGRLDLARAASDRGTSELEPAGVAGAADGGPFVGPYAAAAVRSWTGGGANSNWTTAANWGGTAPVAGDDLVFPGGAARLANTNDFAAGTGFASITISGSGYTLAGNPVALGAGGLTESGAWSTNTVSLPMSVAATATITVMDPGATLTLSGVISGAGGLTKAGAGTLTLSGTNTYTGATTVAAGVVHVQSSTALGTAAGGVTVASGAAIEIDGAGLVIAEPITSLIGTGIAGGGALRNLANANTWSGAITLGGASTVTSIAGTLTVSGTVATAGFGLTVDGAGNLTKTTGAISGIGSLTQTATGTLMISVASTYTGATTVAAGTLRLGVANGVGASSALTVAGGATVDLNGFADTVGSLAGGGAVTNGGAAAVTLTAGGDGTSTAFSGLLADGTGAIALTKAGAGTLTLSGTNTYTGATTVSAGVVHVQSSTALGTAAGGVTVASGAAIEIDGAGLVIAEPITSLIGTGIAGGGALRNLANANTWSGAITLGAGGAAITSDGGTLTLSGGVAGNARPLTVGGVGDTTISGVIATTTGTLTKAGAGTLTLSGTNTYTGATTVSAGALSIGADSALGAAPGAPTAGQLTVSGGTVRATSSFALSANRGIALTGASTIATDAGVTLTYGGVISGAGGLTKAGAGTLTLSGTNTYTGATTVSAGALSIATDAALGAAPGPATPGKLAFGGGTLQATASFAINANRGIALNAGGATFDIASGVTMTYGGMATGTGSMTKAGAGSLSFAAATVFAGSVTISAGSLVGPNAGSFTVADDWTNNASAGAFSAGSGTVTLNGSTGQSVGGWFTTTFNGLTIANASGVTLGADITVTGVLTFTSGVVTTGAHVLWIPAGGSVSRTSGHVAGSLRKHIATGAPSQLFEVGDALSYAPVTIAFASVTTAGDLTVSTTAGDHPQLGSSTLDPSRMAHRYWTLAGTALVFTSCAATFSFVAGDVDASASTGDFVAESYAAGIWAPQIAGTRTSTTTQATGITGFADFAVGELAGSALDRFVVTAPTTAVAGSAFNVTVTAVDAAGNVVTRYTGTITFSSTDAYAAFSPSTYTFVSSDRGATTFVSGAILNAAGIQTVSVSGSAKGGTSAPITVSAGPFDRLLVLVPGETAAPGSPTGRTGTPSLEIANSPFSVTVRAVDAHWNAVSSTDDVAITSSDPDAVLPVNAALVSGTRSFSITLETGGPTTVGATDVTDGTKTAGTSTSIAVTNTAPLAIADSYAMIQDRTLVVAAVGVLANDSDAEGQPIAVASPRPVSGPSHGALTLNADGSFTYVPDPDYSGIDTFTYRATDGHRTSADATVTIAVRSTAYMSTSGWSTTFSVSRYLRLTFPAYVPAGSTVSGATFTHTYRSETAGDTTCYYFEVYHGATLLATHGSAGSPVSCNSTATWATDVVPLPEVDSVARANGLTIVLYAKNSGGRRSVHRLATVGIDYFLR